MSQETSAGSVPPQIMDSLGLNRWGEWATRIILFAFGVRLLCLWSGLDAQTTVHRLSGGFARVTTLIVVIGVAASVGYGYFGPKGAGTYLRRPATKAGLRLIWGCILTVTAAGASEWLWVGFLGMTAQGLTGSPRTAKAQIIFVLSQPYRESCRGRTELRERESREKWDICFHQIFRRSLVNWAPADGDLVELRLNHTMLGDVVTSMERATY